MPEYRDKQKTACFQHNTKKFQPVDALETLAGNTNATVN